MERRKVQDILNKFERTLRKIANEFKWNRRFYTNFLMDVLKVIDGKGEERQAPSDKQDMDEKEDNDV